jgi:hypothetical protein
MMAVLLTNGAISAVGTRVIRLMVAAGAATTTFPQDFRLCRLGTFRFERSSAGRFRLHNSNVVISNALTGLRPNLP